jgi:hypothetical protein
MMPSSKTDPLAALRAKIKTGSAGTPPVAASPPKGGPKTPINPHELDALYQKGAQSTLGSNSHAAGLRAVYDAGVAGVTQ